MRFAYLFLLLNNFVWGTIAPYIYPNYYSIHPIRISFSESGKFIAISNTEEEPIYYSDYNDGTITKGSVRIFENVNGLWNQVGQTIKAGTIQSGSESILGESISLNYSGDRIAISSWGANKTEIYNFNEETNYWEKDGQDLQEGGYNSILNYSGDTLFVGSYFDGLSKIYRFGNGWEVVHEFTTEQNGNASVIDMSADGSTFILAGDGVTKIFKANEGVIAQIGQTLISGEDYYESVYSVDISSSGNVIVLETEAPNYYETGSSQITIFQNLDNEWVRLGNQLQGSLYNGRTKNISLSADGNTVIVNTSIADSNEGSLTSYSLVSDSWVSNNTISELLETYNNDSENHFGGIIAMSPDGEWIAYPIITTQGLEVRIKGINDSDGDGISDHADAFPNDPTETLDIDGDGVGDNSDAFPNDPTETSDSDGDGVGDFSDLYNGYQDSIISDFLSNSDYLKVSEIQDLRPGSIMIEVSENQATVQLQMEESSDLQTWEDTGAPAIMTIPADTDTKFFRFKMAE